jgi:hypothetical protein
MTVCHPAFIVLRMAGSSPIIFLPIFFGGTGSPPPVIADKKHGTFYRNLILINL